MKRKYAQLIRIENNRHIEPEVDKEFFFYLQNGILLALKEQGLLNEMQYRFAEQKLREDTL